MKRLTAFLTAAVMALSVSGCWNGTEKTGATLDFDVGLSYITQELSYPISYVSFGCMTDYGVVFNFSDNSKDRKFHAVLWNSTTEEFTEIPLRNEGMKNDEWVLLALPDGRIGAVDVKGLGNYDTNCCMDIFNSDLQYAESVYFDLQEGISITYDWYAVQHGDETYYAYTYGTNSSVGGSEYEVMVLDSSMEFAGAISLPSYGSLFQGASGELYISFTDQYSRNTMYSHIDLDNFQLEPLDVTIEPGYWQTAEAWDRVWRRQGTNGYEFYTYGNRGICGVKLDGKTGQGEAVLDFSYSGFSPEEIYGSVDVFPSPDGRFLLFEHEKASKKLWLARPRTDEEKESLKAITLAGVNINNQLKQIIRSYNRNHEDSKIFMIDYLQYVPEQEKVLYWELTEEEQKRHDIQELVHGWNYVDPTAAAELLWQDLIDGKVPDIICTDNLPFEQLANKGLFLDLSELMEQDERFHEEDYVMSLFESMKYRGKLQSMAFSFYINTIAGKTEFVGEKQGLTPDEYVALIKNRPADMLPLQTTYREVYMESMLPFMQNSFLDTETLTCTFDSPAFVSLLEIGNELPSYFDETQWEAYRKSYTAYDTALLAQHTLDMPIEYRNMLAGFCNFEDMTLIGYPVVSGGNGCIFSAPYYISINAKSKYQNEVWDIFMELLSEDVQRKLDTNKETYSFPVLRSALNDDLEASTKGANRECTLTPPDVDLMSSKVVYMSGNTEEDRAALEDYINNATMFNYSDQRVTDIIIEEAEMYYAGDRTAEETAKMIQSRVSIYISEQY